MGKESRTDRRVARQVFKTAISGVPHEQLGDMYEDGADHLRGGHVRRRSRKFDQGAAQTGASVVVKLTPEQQQAQSAERAALEVATAKKDPVTAARIEQMMKISMGMKSAAGPRQEP